MAERLFQEFSIPPDPFTTHSAFIYQRDSRAILRLIYKQYIEAAEEESGRTAQTTGTSTTRESNPFVAADHPGSTNVCLRFFGQRCAPGHMFSAVYSIYYTTSSAQPPTQDLLCDYRINPDPFASILRYEYDFSNIHSTEILHPTFRMEGTAPGS